MMLQPKPGAPVSHTRAKILCECTFWQTRSTYFGQNCHHESVTPKGKNLPKLRWNTHIHTHACTHHKTHWHFHPANFNHVPVCVQSQMKMKSADVVDGGLFTESYCNICNAQLISESQRTAHYEVSPPSPRPSHRTLRTDGKEANVANLKGRSLRICNNLSMCCPNPGLIHYTTTENQHLIPETLS